MLKLCTWGEKHMKYIRSQSYLLHMQSYGACVLCLTVWIQLLLHVCTTWFNIHNCTFWPHSVFTCFIWTWEQTDYFPIQHLLVFIIETECVYWAVRTGTLNVTEICFCVWISEQTAIISLYNIEWLVFITETECVYWAVRTGSVNVTSLNFSLWSVSKLSEVHNDNCSVKRKAIVPEDTDTILFRRVRNNSKSDY
jgi:hypothetical protein